jgi:hypothetical protein
MRPWPLVLVVLAGCAGRPLAVLEDGAPADGTNRAPAGDGDSPILCQSTWSCEGGSCTTDGGLPRAGDGWVCHSVRLPDPSIWDVEQVVWECNGRVPDGAGTPDGCGWRCDPVASSIVEGVPEQQYRCVKNHEDGVDTPPGGFLWPMCKMAMDPVCFSCRKGSDLKGSRCVRLGV